MELLALYFYIKTEKRNDDIYIQNNVRNKANRVINIILIICQNLEKCDTIKYFKIRKTLKNSSCKFLSRIFLKLNCSKVTNYKK